MYSMHRFPMHAFRGITNLVKSSKQIRLKTKYYGALVELPECNLTKLIFRAYSNETKVTHPESTVSPLGKLIKNDAAAQQPQQNEKNSQNDEEERKKAREASWRTMKYTLLAFGFSFTCLGGYLLLELGQPNVGEDGEYVQDEFSHMPTWQQYIFRTIQQLDQYCRMIKEPSRDQLLPDVVKYPYYQPPYTLVLEMTDVLVHPDWTYQTGWRFKKRPGIDHFLESLNGLYEIVIYTAEQGMTVFPIIEALDPKQIIAYKLVRDATHFVDGHHVKNLDKLNRDLSKVIVIDWNPNNVKFHPENVFHLKRWRGNDDDTSLLDLAAFLKTVAHSEVEDVREVLKYYNEFEDPLATFRERQKKLIELQEQNRESQNDQNQPVVKRWAPSFLKRNY